MCLDRLVVLGLFVVLLFANPNPLGRLAADLGPVSVSELKFSLFIEGIIVCQGQVVIQWEQTLLNLSQLVPVHGELIESCGDWSLVQPSTVFPPPVGIEIYW